MLISKNEKNLINVSKTTLCTQKIKFGMQIFFLKGFFFEYYKVRLAVEKNMINFCLLFFNFLLSPSNKN